MHDVLDLREMLADEIVQRRVSGHVVAEPDLQRVATASEAEIRPRHWTTPLEDQIASAVFGFDGVRISELAARSLAVARALGA